MNEELFRGLWAQAVGTDRRVSEWPAKMRTKGRDFEDAAWAACWELFFRSNIPPHAPGALVPLAEPVIDMSVEVQMPLKSIMFFIGRDLSDGGIRPWFSLSGGLFP